MIILKGLGEIAGANSQFNSCHDLSCDCYLFFISHLYVPVWQGCVHRWKHESLKDEPTQKRDEVRGSGTGSASSEKNIPELKGSNKRKKLLVQIRHFHSAAFFSPHTVPFDRSRRRGPDCTRLCFSAPWRRGWSWSWSAGSLAPARKRKGRYYHAEPADATSYGADREYRNETRR